MTAEALTQQQQNSRQSFDVIVVGMGPVGLQFIKKMTELNARISIAVFGDEPWGPYNRVKLSSLISGDIREASLYESCSLDDYSSLSAFYNNRIIEIDRSKHEVVDSQGRKYGYGRLVLATGSRAHVPVIDGVDNKNVFCFRDLSDALSLMGRSVRTCKTVVIGGGLLGLEAAKAMQRFNTTVHVIEHDMWLMFRQLDERGSAYLRKYLEATGIHTHTSRHVKKIVGDGKVEGVLLENGVVISCDTVILATGIIPNVQLALESGVRIGRGICVNDKLQTSANDIYAIGECAEHNGQVYGLVGPGYEQAAVLAHHLNGGDSFYKGSISAAKLKVANLPVYSAGEVNDVSSHEVSHVYEDKERSIYRKVVIRNGHICGLVGVGEWPGIQRFQEAISKRRRIWPWQTSRFNTDGVLWNNVTSENVIDWPATATVCNCTGITRGQLDDAVAGGASTLPRLVFVTGASTVCGSCKNLLCDYLGGNVAPEPAMAFRTLLISSVVAFIAALAFFVIPSIDYSASVGQEWHIDMLWRNSFFKQISGFSILGISLIISFISFRKRLGKYIKFIDFGYWRILHVVLGAIVAGLLLMHTGLRMGNNINFYLMSIFCSLLLVGAIAGMAISMEHSMPRVIAKKVRVYAMWSHIVLLWPLPGLLGFHILKTFYF